MLNILNSTSRRTGSVLRMDSVRIRLPLALAAAGFALLVGAAGASVPGENGRIAFVGGQSGGAIYTMNPDGSDARLLTEDPLCRTDGRPAWSPDGGRVSFEHAPCRGDLGQDIDILVVNADGTGRRSLTSGRDRDEQPAWSPDGRTIAFVRNRAGIFVMNADGSLVRRVSEGNDFAPAWSPDGQKIAFASAKRDNSEPALWVMNRDGSGRRRLTELSVTFTPNHPSWSPDGSAIAFSAKQGPDTAVFVIRADGTDLQRISSREGTEPSWSPDGQLIAFSEPLDADIWLMARDGSGLVRIRRGPHSISGEPDWQPVPQQGECTIRGTAGNDVLIGTAGDDVICGFAGDDLIDGRGGNDRIHGGKNNDILSGGSGDDILVGGRGADRLRGQAGHDYLDATDGTGGNDELDGGTGSNTCVGDMTDARVNC